MSKYTYVIMLMVCCFITGAEVGLHYGPLEKPHNEYYLYWFGTLSVLWALMIIGKLSE